MTRSRSCASRADWKASVGPRRRPGSRFGSAPTRRRARAAKRWRVRRKAGFPGFREEAEARRGKGWKGGSRAGALGGAPWEGGSRHREGAGSVSSRDQAAISVGLSKAPGYCAANCLLISVIDPVVRSWAEQCNGARRMIRLTRGPQPSWKPRSGYSAQVPALSQPFAPPRSVPKNPSSCRCRGERQQTWCARCAFVPYISQRAPRALFRVPVARPGLAVPPLCRSDTLNHSASLETPCSRGSSAFFFPGSVCCASTSALTGPLRLVLALASLACFLRFPALPSRRDRMHALHSPTLNQT